jgi:hypothetical protein
MHALSGGPYEPIDPNPNSDYDAGYMNADQPPPAGAYDAAQQSQYSMQAMPSQVPGTMPGAALVARYAPAAHGHLKGALYGVAGAAICCGTKKASRKPSTSDLVKGAVAGALVCWAAQKKTVGIPCTLASVLGGFFIAKFWR